ncbi:MAG: 4'-phosphopantetheinyl transferase superfamily protein [Pseudomonadota bacterium]
MDALHPVILPVPARDQQWIGAATAERLSALARSALTRSAELSGARLGALDKDDAGAPLPTGGWHWSISHKTTYAGGVVSRRAVGLDIEQIREVHPGLFAKTATPTEWDMVERTTDALFRFWTAKEAVLKATATGLLELPQCRVLTVCSADTMVLTLRGRRFTVIHAFFDGHLAAVTDAGGGPIHWHITPA